MENLKEWYVKNEKKIKLNEELKSLQNSLSIIGKELSRTYKLIYDKKNEELENLYDYYEMSLYETSETVHTIFQRYCKNFEACLMAHFQLYNKKPEEINNIKTNNIETKKLIK